jgi:hypothetical protein
MMNKKILDLLYRSFDKELSSAERKHLNEMLQKSKKLRSEQQNIKLMRDSITSSAEQSFSPTFSDQVMARLRMKKQKQTNGVEDFLDSLLWAFKRIALVGSLVTLLLIGFSTIQKGKLSLDSLLALPQVNLEETLELTVLTEGN